jgi:hypothetical protein
MRARPSLARGPALACACESVSGECIRSAALASAILFHLPSPRRAHRLLYATAVHTKGADPGLKGRRAIPWPSHAAVVLHALDRAAVTPSMKVTTRRVSS